MSATLFTSSKYSATDANGLPLAFGLVYTHAAGSLTPQATYTSQSGASPNTNPVVLDASGRANIWLGPYAYRFIVKSAAGVLMPDGDTDNITNPTALISLTLPTTDLMVGDGTTTIYTLSANPANVNNVFFSLGGAIQVPGVDYTLSGLVITCTSPPPAGVAGFFNYTVALPTGTLDAALVTHSQTTNYPDGSIGAQIKFEVWAKLKTTNTAAQNDAAFLAAASQVQSLGGGTLRLPPGNFPHSRIAWNMATYPKVSIRGAGKYATTLTKADSTTTPVLDIYATGLVQAFTNYADFTIVGNAVGSLGLSTTLIAMFTLRNIAIAGCSVGWANQGSLIASIYECDLRYNTVGYRAIRALSGAVQVYPNLISFYGGQVINNASIGFDFVHGQGIAIDHVDIELNGVSGNAATGGVFIRSTVTLEYLFATYSIANNTWFEGNAGSALTVEATPNLMLTQTDVHYYRRQLTDTVNQMTIGAIESSLMKNVFAVSSLSGGMTTSVAGSRSTVIGGQFTVLTDSSVSKVHQNVATSTELITFRTGAGLDIAGQRISAVYALAGSGSVTLPLQAAVATGAGCLLLITGADASGVAYARVYLIALMVGGGVAPLVATTLVGTTGSAVPTWTFSVVANQLVATVASGNTARLAFTGMT